MSLTEKQINLALQAIESEKAKLMEALNQGGVTAIGANGLLFAAFKGTTSSRRSK